MSEMNSEKRITRAGKMLFLMEKTKDKFVEALEAMSEAELQRFLKEYDLQLTQLSITPKQRVLDKIDLCQIKKRAIAEGTWKPKGPVNL